MAVGKISIRYAKAIFDSIKKESAVRTVAKELQAFGEMIAANKELKALTDSQGFSEKQKRGVVEDLVAKMGASDETKKVLLVLSENNRLSAVKGIAERLNVLLLNASSIVPLKVESSNQLDDSDKSKIENKFTQVLGKKVEATYHVDPGLLGGLKVTAGSRTYDGSIEGWLIEMEERLMGGSH